MASTRSLLDRLSDAFPHLTFQESEDGFLWSPETQTVWYRPADAHFEAQLLHEVGHALLDHHHYRRDVELLSMETDAWHKALELSDAYGVTIDDDTIQDHLDTYRDWMHSRSSCPECDATGHQKQADTYACLACAHSWRVNEARVCALRRYSLAI